MVDQLPARVAWGVWDPAAKDDVRDRLGYCGCKLVCGRGKDGLASWPGPWFEVSGLLCRVLLNVTRLIRVTSTKDDLRE